MPREISCSSRDTSANPDEVGWVGGWRGDAVAFRFQSPPVEPCVRFSRTRLTDALHRRCSVSPSRPGGAWVQRRFRSMPGAPSLRRTWLHARCSTSLRWTLSYSAWNRRSGSALAARYSACCRARTASSRRSTPEAGLAHTALTGHSLSTCAWTKQRPFPSPAVVLSVRLDRYYGRLRRRPGRSPTSRLDTGYRTPRSGASPQSPGRGRPPLFPPSPSQRSAPSTPGSSSRLCSRFCTASMAFTLKDGARLSLDPAAHGHFHDTAGFA